MDRQISLGLFAAAVAIAAALLPVLQPPPLVVLGLITLAVIAAGAALIPVFLPPRMVATPRPPSEVVAPDPPIASAQPQFTLLLQQHERDKRRRLLERRLARIDEWDADLGRLMSKLAVGAHDASLDVGQDGWRKRWESPLSELQSRAKLIREDVGEWRVNVPDRDYRLGSTSDVAGSEKKATDYGSAMLDLEMTRYTLACARATFRREIEEIDSLTTDGEF